MQGEIPVEQLREFEDIVKVFHKACVYRKSKHTTIKSL
jgi:hypothetical protein